jgi:hypothetical protein
MSEDTLMRRSTRTLATSFALLLGAAGATASAHASAARGGDRIAVHLVNKGDNAQTIKVDGHIYAVRPHDGLEVKVPAGTVVYAAGASTHYHDGDKLLAVTPDMKDKIIYFNCDDCQVGGS